MVEGRSFTVQKQLRQETTASFGVAATTNCWPFVSHTRVRGCRFPPEFPSPRGGANVCTRDLWRSNTHDILEGSPVSRLLQAVHPQFMTKKIYPVSGTTTCTAFQTNDVFRRRATPLGIKTAVAPQQVSFGPVLSSSKRGHS